MRLSVIIPVASDRLENLRLVLTSLTCQTFKDFEVIVINDGGGVDIERLIRRFHGLDLHYVRIPKFVPGVGIQPRNVGAQLARHDFYVFADSDVILRSDVLELYVEDLNLNSNRIIAGIYHWLTPMHITTSDVEQRFDDIIAEKLPPRKISIPPTHSICRDYRMATFNAVEPHEVFHTREMLLGAFSGNICWPKDIFWDTGGFWNELSAGLVEDGASGLAAYFAGHSISFDRRIIGGHLYHPRNLAFIIKQSQVEVERFERFFHIGRFNDGRPPGSYKGWETR